MKKILLPFILITLIVAACEPLPTTPQFVTQIPFYASQTPEFIIPVTDTPIVSEPFTETPAFIVPVTETPTPEFIIPVPETPTPVPLAGWWEVYFTDPLAINNPDAFAGSIEEKLIQWINAAQVSIHIASFEFNLTPVAEALIAAKNRGVDVKWITDDEYGLKIDSEPERRQFSLLMGAGIEVKDDAGREAFMHNKFWIFDQQAVWTGSTNITVNGIFKQNNNVIVLRSPEIAYIYEREFQELWSGQFGPRAPSTISNQWAILDTTPVQVLFSSEDNAMSSLLAVVNDAKFSIRFLAFSFTDDALAQTMIERFKAGVDVQGVYETLASTSIYSDLKTFWCAGVPVRQDGNGSLMHNKVIIVDNSTVITGSLNFTAGANEKNEENVIIIDNPEIAALYLQEYAKIWSLAHDVEAGTFTCQ
ncbi:MAG TPA: phospholipase D-like domain-containing protein [Anaerolineales bacterium]|nr:phospholipase D-like domain-containing protein [Anaerolineales bacterium]HNA54871.1 phospholipase D-like domain-containing protein [Anaerolineales bacterium]HNE68709.1 phospholipase D-like domain-containing protein [Anaerolineales bacterium]HNH04795.1 phospholipase D-like domain-containing protein [Anaerolineales bacterium]